MLLRNSKRIIIKVKVKADKPQRKKRRRRTRRPGRDDAQQIPKNVKVSESKVLDGAQYQDQPLTDRLGQL
jgi:hypothetical protein